MDRISFFLDKCVSRISCSISHWIDTFMLLFLGFDSAFSKLCASILFGIKAASLDVSYSVIKAWHWFCIKTHSFDESSGSCSVYHSLYLHLTNLHYQNDSARINHSFLSSMSCYDAPLAELKSTVSHSINIMSADMAYSIAKFAYRIGYYFSTSDTALSSCKTIHEYSMLASNLHYQDALMKIAYNSDIQTMHSDLDISSVNLKMIKPVYLKDYTFSIGNPSVLLKDWCYEEI